MFRYLINVVLKLILILQLLPDTAENTDLAPDPRVAGRPPDPTHAAGLAVPVITDPANTKSYLTIKHKDYYSLSYVGLSTL